jgi:hypothetical protein
MKRVLIALGLVAVVVEDGGRGLMASEVGGFFPCGEIIFFGPCSNATPIIAVHPNAERPRSPAAAREIEETMWAEPVGGPDGHLRVYVPPKSVRDFLENPTAGNARAYLAWNQARMRHLDEAVKVLREVAAQQLDGDPQLSTRVSAAPPSRDSAVGTRTLSSLPSPLLLAPSASGRVDVKGHAGDDAGQISILYAFATWCPYSRPQTTVMNQLATHVPVQGVAFDSNDADVQALRGTLAFPVVHGDIALQKRLGIQSYPTILFSKGGRFLHIARGFQPADRLLTVLAALPDRGLLPMRESGIQSAGDICHARS